MSKYSVHVWVTPVRPVQFPAIEAKNINEAWEKLGQEHKVLERKGSFGFISYDGKNGRVYRRKVKVARLQ